MKRVIKGISVRSNVVKAVAVLNTYTTPLVQHQIFDDLVERSKAQQSNVTVHEKDRSATMIPRYQ